MELYQPCESCPLHEGVQTYCMMGTGPMNAKIFACGEGPGRDEDREGRQFVGAAGLLLRKQWENILGFPFDDVFVTNCVRCRPPDNRTPYKKEVQNCWPFMEEELKQIKPEVIVPIGLVAMHAFGVPGKITSNSGKIFTVQGRTVIPLLHPAAVIRNMRQLPVLTKGLGQIKAFLEHGHSIRYGEYEIIGVDDYESLQRILGEAAEANIIDIDIETNGLDEFAEDARIKCISISTDKECGCTIPLEGWRDRALLSERLRLVLEDPTIKKSGQRLGFEYKWLKQILGITLRGIGWDTRIGAFELDKLTSPGLKESAWKVGMGGYEQGFTSGKKVAEEEGEDLFKYCAMDADATGRVRRYQYEQLSPEQKQYIEKQALPLITVFSEMHLRGLRVDTDRLDIIKDKSIELMTFLEDRIRSHKYVRRASQGPYGDFNPRSTRHVRFLLFGILQAEVYKRTPSGAPSTDEETLRRLAVDFPSVVGALLDYRTAQKFKSTYVDAISRHIAPDGKIHATFSQTTARSGRSATQDPNVQNWPHKPPNVTERYPSEYQMVFSPRNVIIPEDGCEFWGADFGQQELRVAAAVSRDPVMIEILSKDPNTEKGDIHAQTAHTLFPNWNELSKEERDHGRRVAKTINFGILYGMSKFELAKRIGYTEEKAHELIGAFFRKYYGYARWVEETKQFLNSHGYVETPTGRRRNFPPLDDLKEKDRAAIYREAVNTPIQGPAYDLCANALIRMHKACKRYGLRSFFVNTIHDENMVNGYPDEWETFRDIYTEIATTPPEWIDFMGKIPLGIDWKRGPRWGEMEEVSGQTKN